MIVEPAGTVAIASRSEPAPESIVVETVTVDARAPAAAHKQTDVANNANSETRNLITAPIPANLPRSAAGAQGKAGLPGLARAPVSDCKPKQPRKNIYSRTGRVLEPQVRALVDEIQALPHTIDVDELGGVEIARLTALIEAVDADLAERGLTNRRTGNALDGGPAS